MLYFILSMIRRGNQTTIINKLNGKKSEQRFFRCKGSISILGSLDPFQHIYIYTVRKWRLKKCHFLGEKNKDFDRRKIGILRDAQTPVKKNWRWAPYKILIFLSKKWHFLLKAVFGLYYGSRIKCPLWG